MKLKRVKCKHCGRLFKKLGLGSHIWRVHGKGKKHSPNKGSKYSDETKQLISDNVTKLHQHGKLPGYPLCKKHSKATKKKISEALKGNRNANHRGDRRCYYKKIRMDSSWEVKTAKYLDDNNIDWVYGEKGFKLSDNRWYYPDFFIYKNNVFKYLIEVKGYFRPANKQKFEQFKEEYPEVQVKLWDKKELVKRKII